MKLFNTESVVVWNYTGTNIYIILQNVKVFLAQDTSFGWKYLSNTRCLWFS